MSSEPEIDWATIHPDYPTPLKDIAVGEKFYMYNYENEIYMRIRLPEAYEVGMNRIPMSIEMKNPNPYIIRVSRDGDGYHLPIMNSKGTCFFMSKNKPCRRIE